MLLFLDYPIFLIASESLTHFVLAVYILFYYQLLALLILLITDLPVNFVIAYRSLKHSVYIIYVYCKHEQILNKTTVALTKMMPE